MSTLIAGSGSTDGTVTDRVWISSADAAAVAEKGFRIIHAPSNYFYLVSSRVLLTVKTSLSYHHRIAVPVDGWEVTQLGSSSSHRLFDLI